MILWSARTYFSVGESIISPAELIDAAKTAGYSSVALADTMTLSGVIEAGKQAKKSDIGLIAGLTLRVKNPWDQEGDKPSYYCPKLYALSERGFKLLMQALSKSYKAARTGLRYTTHQEFVALAASREFAISTGDVWGAVSSLFSEDQSKQIANDLVVAGAGDLCMAEVTHVDTPYMARHMIEAVRLATEFDWPIVRSVMPLYIEPDDAQARDVMACIASNQKVGDRWVRKLNPGRYLRTVSEFNEDLNKQVHILKALGEPSIKETLSELVSRFKRGKDFAASQDWYRWEKSPISLPKMADDEHAELVRLCKEGFKSRIMRPVFGYQPDKVLLPKYVERLKYELDVLGRMGFSGYFLLVADLVQWSKSQGIIVGPGRGSVGGSLVAFIMGITEVDPIRFGLLFERFINPERLDLPDADLDFMSDRRHEVIQYLRDKYGSECVAGISNYNSLGPPSAIREVGKAFDLPLRDYEVSKLVPKEHGESMTLDDAADAIAEIRVYADKYPKQWDISKRLTHCVRSMGTHAAGVVVASVPLHERAAVEEREDGNVINWDKRVVEEQGLVKIDILGLTNLDVIKRSTDKIERYTGTKIDILEIPLDDEKVLAAFGRGETVGVFQFESAGMRKLLMDMAKGGPLTFDELAAATALYRPGPLDSGMVQEYIDVRNGHAYPHFPHPMLEDALSKTYGVAIYQEQTMAISRTIAGFSGAEADGLRKAIGKKDMDKMEEFREAFIDGATSGYAEVEFEDGSKRTIHLKERFKVKESDQRLTIEGIAAKGFGQKITSITKLNNGMDQGPAEALWDSIEANANYQFNASHSVEYSLISYVTMWLKVHYPLHFYASCLEVMKEERLKALVEDANRRGIEILPPCVNESTHEFAVVGAKQLRVPLNRIKGLSARAEEAVLTERKFNGPYRSFMDFENRVPKAACNKRHKDHLDKVGAFASIEKGQLASTHPDRLRDQNELIPGLMSRAVIVSREIVWDDFTKEQVKKCVVFEARRISEAVPPMPCTGRKPKMMVIFDCPTNGDERAGRLMSCDGSNFVKDAMGKAGLNWSRDAYFTAFCKIKKADKKLSATEIRTWRPLLDKELEIVNPPLIVCLGSEISRTLCPNEKGSIMELAGKVVYDKKLDANIVLGINPGMVWMDASRQDLLDHIFEQVAGLVC
jgi:DNA polymerase III subunit alpha